MLNHKYTLKFGIQFFADGESEGGEGQGTHQEEQNEQEGTGTQSGKTFTQEEVNSMMRKEKESAKKALLRELGVEDAKTAKEGLAKYREILDKDKTAAEKAGEDLAAANKAKQDAEERAILAEAKVEVLSVGCKPECVDDVIVLALKKVSDDKDLKAVVKEMKKDSKYSSFFGESDSGSGDHGTGGGSGYRKNPAGDKKGSIGAKLGQQAGKTVANPYFKN